MGLPLAMVLDREVGGGAGGRGGEMAWSGGAMAAAGIGVRGGCRT